MTGRSARQDLASNSAITSNKKEQQKTTTKQMFYNEIRKQIQLPHMTAECHPFAGQQLYQRQQSKVGGLDPHNLGKRLLPLVNNIFP